MYIPHVGMLLELIYAESKFYRLWNLNEGQGTRRGVTMFKFLYLAFLYLAIIALWVDGFNYIVYITWINKWAIDPKCESVI